MVGRLSVLIDIDSTGFELDTGKVAYWTVDEDLKYYWLAIAASWDELGICYNRPAFY